MLCVRFGGFSANTGKLCEHGTCALADQIGWGVSGVNSKKIDFSAKGFSFVEKTGCDIKSRLNY